jgi:hypothetical protein
MFPVLKSTWLKRRALYHRHVNGNSLQLLATATIMRRAALYVALLGSLSHTLAQGINNDTTDDSLLWGTYRPNLYFGLRPRLPQSLMTGLMWFGTHNFQSLTSMYLNSNVKATYVTCGCQRRDMLATKVMVWLDTRGPNRICAKEECRS